MLTKNNSQSGVSLVELMVGIVIALIILTGVLTLMLRITTEGAGSVKGTRLNQEMRGTMEFLSRELQRAGYFDWVSLGDPDGDGVLTDVYAGDVGTYTGSYINMLDFYVATNDARNLFGDVDLYTAMTTSACTSGCTCVLYSYDLNRDGYQGVGTGVTTGAGQNQANAELFGFRLNTSTDRIEMISGGEHACDDADTTWEAVTDASVVRITDLTFDMAYYTGTDIDDDTGTDIYTSVRYALTGIDNTGGLSDPDPDISCTPSVSGTYPGDDSTDDTVCIGRRKISIYMRGELADDDSVEVELESDVKIKNDFLDTQ